MPLVISNVMSNVIVRWLGLVVLVVAVAAMAAATWPTIDDTPAAIAPMALCGGAMVGVTLLAWVKLAPRIPRAIVAVLAAVAAFCGYGAGAEWWANGASGTWAFFVWGLIFGPLPIVVIALLGRLRTRG